MKTILIASFIVVCLFVTLPVSTFASELDATLIADCDGYIIEGTTAGAANGTITWELNVHSASDDSIIITVGDTIEFTRTINISGTWDITCDSIWVDGMIVWNYMASTGPKSIELPLGPTEVDECPCDRCEDVVCDDDLCKTGVCDPATGECVYQEKNCADGDKCTIDSCDPNRGCINTEIICDDDDKCTMDSCDPDTGECVNKDKICDDNDECTDDECNPETGSCVYEENGLCEECPPAYPKTQGYWQRQCRALGLIGKSMGMLKLHEEWMADLSDEEQREICGNLNAISNDMCSKAGKQLQAVMLNRRSERIANCNCIMPEGTVGSAIEMIIEMIADGDCKDANNLADGINTGDYIVECRDQEPPKPPTGVIIE